MTWDEVKNKIIFWQDGAWNIHLEHEPSEVPPTEQTYILNTIKSWFENSDYSDARNAVEAVIARYGLLRIGHSDLGGFTIHPMGTNDAYITLDTNNDPLDHYLTPTGYWQANELYISLLHEIMHLGYVELDPAHPNDNKDLYESLMNDGSFDYVGPTVRRVNDALEQMGLSDHQRSSYQAVIPETNANSAEFQSGISYTGGATVSFSRVGFRGRNDNMDISARTDGANALMFGLDGTDTLVGNRGNDFLYGGDDNDFLTGGGGNDQLWGGTLNEHGRADGTDTARYQSAPAGITINLNGGFGVPVTVQDGQGGTDALHSIERIEGSAHADTLVLSDLTQAIASDFDYIDLGAGTDTVNVSALSGTVTVSLANPQDQSVAYGDAVLHLRNVENIVGSTGTQDTLAIDSSSGLRVDGAGGVLAWAGSVLFGYSGFETIVGGAGDDRIFGGDTGTYIGGGGANYIEGSANAVLESTTGDTYFWLTGGGTVISGAGNDYIRVSGNEPVTIKFGVGSGHDMLGSYFTAASLDTTQQDDWALDRRFDLILLEGLSPDDVELVWDFTETREPEAPQVWYREGEAVLRIKSTGETLYLGTLRASGNDVSGFRYQELEGKEIVDGQIVDWGWDSIDYQRVDPNWTGGYTDNDSDPVHYNTIEMRIFSFDGVNRVSLLDLFDLRAVSYQPLPVEAKAAADILQRISLAPVVGSERGDNLDGSDQDDDMLGGSGNDVLNGAGGNDFMRGDSGADSIFGGIGNDHAEGGSENDSLDGGENDDLLRGDAGDDTLTGAAGSDRLEGGIGNDVLNGGAGDDLLDGGAGNDAINGDIGIDAASYASATAGVTVNLSSTKAQNTVGAGTDTLTGIENLVGSAFADALTGSAGDNFLSGGNGNDVINGGRGNDILTSGDGNDTLTGGNGSDNFVFDGSLNASTNVDRITDFSAGTDKFQLSQTIFAGLGQGTLVSFAFHVGASAHDSDDRIIYDSASGKIYYDPDGIGGANQILFAQVNSGVALTSADFVVDGLGGASAMLAFAASEIEGRLVERASEMHRLAWSVEDFGFGETGIGARQWHHPMDFDFFVQ